ncbi:uncharacterized protein HaLaN_15303, partial [Haematococcus lacustris]
RPYSASADQGGAWLQPSQRSAAMLVALLALQPGLRSKLTQGELVGGLAACIVNNMGRTDMWAPQLRITAAAALVPLLSRSCLLCLMLHLMLHLMLLPQTLGAVQQEMVPYS